MTSITMKNVIREQFDLNHQGFFHYDVSLKDTYDRDGNYFKLYGDDLTLKRVKIDFNNPNFPHDSVYYCLTGCFDSGIKLKMLSPDFICDEFILELTTTITSDEEMMEKRLMGKELKYKSIQGEKKLLVLVVSFDKVVSNYEVSLPLCNALCSNFMNVKKLQSELLEEGKSYWFNVKDSNFNKRLDSILINYEPIVNYEGMKAAFEMIDEAWSKFDYKISLEKVHSEISTKLLEMTTSLNFIEEKNLELKMPTDGRKHLKRVTVVPLICPKLRTSSSLIKVECLKDLLPKSKYKIIQEGEKTQKTQDQFATPITKFQILSGMLDEKAAEKKTKKGYQFKPELAPSELIELNLDGIMAKEAKYTKEVREKRLESKCIFSADVSTADIEKFRLDFHDLITEEIEESPKNQAYELMMQANECIRDANVNLTDIGKSLIQEYHSENKIKLYNWMNFVSDLMFEINLSLRENTNKGFFIVKCLKRFNADVYIKTTNSNSHIFFFVVCKKDYILSETVGPKFVEKDDICVTEWGSMLKRDLENFLNFSETIRSTFACYDEIFDDTHEKAKTNAKWLSLMILLSNKDRNEEILTSLRYTYMKSLSITENSCTMNKKLSLLFRDRLQVYLTKLVFNLNNNLSINKPKITFVLGNLEVSGLLDLFGNPINFKECINLSYSGYIMTKVKQPQSNQASKMIEKILEYEMKFQDVKVEEISISNLRKMKSHCFDYEYVRVFCQLGMDLIKMTYGTHSKLMIEKRIQDNLSKIDFESISTLKASAKLEINSKLNEENLKNLQSARPRVLTNIVYLIKKYNPTHFIDLLVPCIKHVKENDSFNVELFPKDQHNGLREIYVVDIHIRIIQLFLESISRAICSFFQSETLNHPKNASAMLPKTLKDCLESNSNPFCLMKSGDASKWSQSQITTKFYIALKIFLPDKYHKVVKDCLSLWFDKKIFLPPALIHSFMNTDFQTKNVILNNLREGTLDNIRKKDEMFMRVRSGFMQGILHHSSSLFHTLVQEGFRQFQFKFLHSHFESTKFEQSLKNLRISILQGSDDSSSSIMGDATMFKYNKELFLSLMHLKDALSFKFGIIPSAEKTATCVPFIIEYNSQWLALGKSVQPTIKFAMVSCQLPASQSLIQRQEFYYNLLKDCLEKGCSTSLCFKIKLSQMSSHYALLGCNNASSFDLTKTMLLSCLNPSLGFFILEPVVATAVFGFDYSFYCHTQGALMKFLPSDFLVPSECSIPAGNSLLVNAHVSKTSWKKWKKLVESVGELSEEENKYLEDNAYLYYEKTNDTYSSLLKIKQKIQDFDVKQSLSSRYGITENMASFFCTFLKVCKIGKEKDSLIGWMMKCVERKEINLSHMFPKHSIYGEISEHISQLSEQSYLIDENYVIRGRSQIVVLHNKTAENEMFFDTVKCHWFDTCIDDVSKLAYDKLFDEYKKEFDWLKDTEAETKKHLKCSSRQLANYIRNIVGKNRTLTFYDTVAKGSSYPYLLSRIFQKGKKIQIVRRKKEKDLTNEAIFSNLRILLDLPYTDSFKSKVANDLINKLDLNKMQTKEKLKYTLLRCLMNGETEEFKKEIFKYSFDNHVTWFSQVQHFNKQFKTWEGEGCLTTIMSYLTIKTQICDNMIKKILVNDIEAFRENLNTYFKIIKEQRFIFDTTLDGKLRLSKQGLSNQNKGSLVVVVPELKIKLDNFKSARVAFTNGNIKIVAPMTEDDSDNFRYKEHCLTTLYKISIKRIAKDLKERRLADSRGYIEEDVWIDSRKYREARDGPILQINHKLGGKDVKVSTIMNFEIWKNPVSISFDKLFEWGEIGEKIVYKETLEMQDYVKTKLNNLPSQLPCDEIFKFMMEENNFNPDHFLNYVSKVEFFNVVADPEYDELVKKDDVQKESNELLDSLMNLMFNPTKMANALVKTKELDECLLSLDNSIVEASTDFSMTRFTIYGLRDVQTAFPNLLFYKFNHEMHRLINDENELLNIISFGDKSNQLTLYHNVFLKMFFNTPLTVHGINTVKRLNEFLLLGYIPKSSRTSRSSSRLGIFVPDSVRESNLLKRFKLHPKMPDFKLQLELELSLTKEAIDETTTMVEKTINRRVKNSLITQLSEYKDDYELLLSFKNECDEDTNHDNMEEKEDPSCSHQSVDEFDDEGLSVSELSEYSQGNSDVEGFQITKELLELQYPFMDFPLEQLIKFTNIGLSTWLLQGKSLDLTNLSKISAHTTYLNGDLIFDAMTDYTIWIDTIENVFYVFSHQPILGNSNFERIFEKVLINISPEPKGSCLFNSFSYLLKEMDKTYTNDDLRMIVKNSSYNLEFDDNNYTLRNHRNEILEHETWGDETDISTLCYELNMSVKVVTDDTILTYNTQGHFLGWLVNHDNIHFNVLI